jgi:hypothetical protein
VVLYLKFTSKTQKLLEWNKTHDPTIWHVQEIHFKYNDTYGLKVNSQRNIYNANSKRKHALLHFCIECLITLHCLSTHL